MIFGVGKTLYNNWQYIKKYYNPDYAVDNNPDKWGKYDEYTGLKCIAPEDIFSNDSSVEVLITVGDPYFAENIKLQLHNMSINAIYLSDMIKEWSEYEQFPYDINVGNDGKRIWLLNTPEHDNLGDHLIAESECALLKRIKPEYEVIEITDMEYVCHKEKLKKIINVNDLIIITGGGFLGSMWLYNGENTVREILTDYPENRIVIFPQTIFFEDNERGRKEFLQSSDVYKSHDNLDICLREKNSYDMVKTFIPDESKLHLLPDMALFFDYNSDVKRANDRIALCLRNDKESVLTADDKEEILGIVKQQKPIVNYISTHSGIFDGNTSREEQIYLKMQEIASYSIIITDTLHCMIFAALCGTPCIAIDNISNKVSSVYEWIKELEYVRMCRDISEISSILKELVNKPGKYELINRDKYEAEIKGLLDR